ncbi:hypothetical protein [Streptomyces tendae]|uniref:hypothetical protein n=1 Tax=Streptomyces tendae TaxID=1932 RepID=UPI0037A91D09
MSFRGHLLGLLAVPVVVGGYADVRAADGYRAGGRWPAYGAAGLAAVTTHLGLRRRA